MKRIHRRSLAVLLLVLFVISCMGIYLVRFFTNAGQWVGFAANSHLYHDGEIKGFGIIYDRDGENVLSSPGEDGNRIYNSDEDIRISTLHSVGDLQGRIGTGALRVFSDKLTGYNFITGLYGLSGKGNLLYLTIDSDVCAAAYRALDGRKGAVGIYNYITGDIVCLVSTPGFDPEDPPEITEENEDQYDGIYLNRFLLSAYTPGSIFKIVTSAAAIDCIGDIEDRVFSCTGSMIIDGVEITCPHAHGDVDFQEALTVSCNCAFAQIADELGSTNLFAYAESAGLLNPLDVSGIKTQTGSIDLNNISDGELAWAGIGQHKDLVNPCAFMYYMGSIARDGSAAQPRLIQKVTTASGFPLSLNINHNGNQTMSADTAMQLKMMMRNNVLNNYGDDQFPDVGVCAKSGTAEVSEDQSPHAWFSGFCTDENFPYAFVAIIENGGSGSNNAAPVVAEALTELYEKQR